MIAFGAAAETLKDVSLEVDGEAGRVVFAAGIVKRAAAAEDLAAATCGAEWKQGEDLLDGDHRSQLLVVDSGHRWVGRVHQGDLAAGLASTRRARWPR